MNVASNNSILSEQVKLLCRHTPVIVGGTLIVTALLVYVLSAWFPLQSLLIRDLNATSGRTP